VVGLSESDVGEGGAVGVIAMGLRVGLLVEDVEMGEDVGLLL